MAVDKKEMELNSPLEEYSDFCRREVDVFPLSFTRRGLGEVCPPRLASEPPLKRGIK
jgi:hypothetical protein